MRASTLNPLIDETWDTFFTSCLAHKPEERFATVPEARKAFDQLAGHWQKQRGVSCRLLSKREEIKNGRSRELRSIPQKVSPCHARSIFGLDAKRSPLYWMENDFSQVNGELIHDAFTGLLWQKNGSEFPFSWQEAHGYIRG